MNDPLLPETEIPANPPAKGMSFWKSALLSLLAAAAVFLIWLLYPVKPPAAALRGYLPEECLVTGEIHSPAAVNSELLGREFGGKFARLPVYPRLAEALKADGIDLEQTGKDLLPQLQLLESSLIGLRNCQALAFGATAGARADIIILASLDNLGLTLVKAAALFLPPADDGACRRIPQIPDLKNLSQQGMNIDNLYLKTFPGTRLVAVSSSTALLRRCRLEAPATPRSLYAEGEQQAAELTVNLGGPLALAAMLPGHELAKFRPLLEEGKNASGEIFGWWRYDQFRCEARFALPDAAGAAGKPLRMFTPPDAPGLHAALSAPADIVNADTLALALEMAIPGAAATLEPSMPALRQMTQDASGGYFLSLFPAGGHADGAFHWTVGNPGAAQKNFAKGLEKMLAAQKKNAGLLGALSPASLVQVKKTPGRLKISAPLTPPAYAGFSGTGDTARAGLGGTWPLPPCPELTPCVPQTLAAVRVKWRHSPEIIKKLCAEISADLKALGALLKILGVDEDTLPLQDAGEALNACGETLASCEECTLDARTLADPARGGTALEINIAGTLRLDAPRPDAARAGKP